MDWPAQKDNFYNNILLIFAEIKIWWPAELELYCQSSYYGTTSLTFCRISGLKEAFVKIIKYQTALKNWVLGACMHLIGQKNLTITRMFSFSGHGTEICPELCCQSIWDIFLNYLPGLSLGWSITAWTSVLDMKQQHILKLILLTCITCLSTGIISRIPCFINDLLLYVVYLSSCFGNSKMVKNVSWNLFWWILVSLGVGSGLMCGRHMIQDWIGQKKKTILATLSYLFLLK